MKLNIVLRFQINQSTAQCQYCQDISHFMVTLATQGKRFNLENQTMMGWTIRTTHRLNQKMKHRRKPQIFKAAKTRFLNLPQNLLTQRSLRHLSID